LGQSGEKLADDDPRSPVEGTEEGSLGVVAEEGAGNAACHLDPELQAVYYLLDRMDTPQEAGGKEL
jgi:hypothetical protein